MRRFFPHSLSKLLFSRIILEKLSRIIIIDLGSIPELGRSPGEGKGYPLQYCGLENSMDCLGHRVAELDTTESLSLPFY